MNAPLASGWKLDKHIPVVALVVWLFSMLGAVWWVAKVDAQVQANTMWIAQNGNLSSRLAGIEVKLDLLLEDRRGSPPYVPGR